MSADVAGRIAGAMRRTRVVHAVRSTLLLAYALALPYWAFVGFDSYDGWHWSVLSHAIRGGYVDEDWAGYLFQQDYPHYVTSVGDWFGNPFAFVVTILVGFIALARVLEGIAVLVTGFAVTRKEQWKGHPSSVLSRAFSRGRLLALGDVAGVPVEVGVHRGVLLLSVEAGGAVPPIVLEATRSDRRRHVRALRLSHDDAAVMEGEFLERWRIHAPRSLLRAVPRLLTPSVLKDLASVETATYLESAGNRVFAVYPARALRTPEAVTAEVERLRVAALGLSGATSDAPDVRTSYDLSARVGAWRTRSLQVGRLVLHGWWSLVLLLGLVVADFIEEAVLSGGVSEDVMLLHAVVIGWLLMLRVRTPGIRWIRARGAEAD